MAQTKPQNGIANRVKDIANDLPENLKTNFPSISEIEKELQIEQ